MPAAILERSQPQPDHNRSTSFDEVHMGTETMGKVLVTATVENLDDLFAAQKGLLPEDKIRRIEGKDALVDTGAPGLLLPRKMTVHWGLEPLRPRTARTTAGHLPLQVYRAVRLSVQGRD